MQFYSAFSVYFSGIHLIQLYRIGWSRSAGLMVLGVFHQNSEYTKVCYWCKKIFDRKNFKKFRSIRKLEIKSHVTALNLGSLKNSLNCIQNWSQMQNRSSTSGIGVENRKFRKNNDFLRKKILEHQKHFAPPLNYVFHK